MADNFYSDIAIQKASECIKPKPGFLVDNFSSLDTERGIFPRSEVLIQYRDIDSVQAPFVSERQAAPVVEREGYEMITYKPARIALSRQLTYDELTVRSFGEDVYSHVDPATREGILLRDDMQQLSDRISVTEETMLADLMLNNAVTVSDRINGKVTDTDVVKFYEGDVNPARKSLGTLFDDANAKPIDAIGALLEEAEQEGIMPTTLLCSPKVARTIRANKQAQDLFDNRRITIGELFSDKVTTGAANVGTLVIDGFEINIVTYALTYLALDGTRKRYIPEDMAILCDTDSAEWYYGGEGSIEQGSNSFVTKEGQRIAKFLADPRDNTRTITVSSHPLVVPKQKNCFISFKAISD